MRQPACFVVEPRRRAAWLLPLESSGKRSATPLWFTRKSEALSTLCSAGALQTASQEKFLISTMSRVLAPRATTSRASVSASFRNQS